MYSLALGRCLYFTLWLHAYAVQSLQIPGKICVSNYVQIFIQAICGKHKPEKNHILLLLSVTGTGWSILNKFVGPEAHIYYLKSIHSKMHKAKKKIKLTKKNKHELAISLKPTVTMSITLLLCCASLKALN